ncbi:translation initiation factor IF-2-like isoform X2 [Panicum virgatum]|uniref:Uncharacterized protein n=1 Tax=Panicum virgatum TaxID=38727 RepID=A0A8T0WYP3_PANVG|nr:translation initiation factor IF-2-like isoform X2 [Panicum virgatum]XP_039789519.1 translation initiation factor IF-2-like isoform X2 [Panicum virgatum]XP_039789520.1 translation initiation factor IF-2-like isoform X2 [Panicum virgatum]KAG2650756.1 hypothetical protein PVAP13_1NG170600 [Panicum virgatum]
MTEQSTSALFASPRLLASPAPLLPSTPSPAPLPPSSLRRIGPRARRPSRAPARARAPSQPPSLPASFARGHSGGDLLRAGPQRRRPPSRGASGRGGPRGATAADGRVREGPRRRTAGSARGQARQWTPPPPRPGRRRRWSLLRMVRRGFPLGPIEIQRVLSPRGRLRRPCAAAVTAAAAHRRVLSGRRGRPRGQALLGRARRAPGSGERGGACCRVMAGPGQARLGRVRRASGSDELSGRSCDRGRPARLRLARSRLASWRSSPRSPPSRMQWDSPHCGPRVSTGDASSWPLLRPPEPSSRQRRHQKTCRSKIPDWLDVRI